MSNFLIFFKPLNERMNGQYILILGRKYIYLEENKRYCSENNTDNNKSMYQCKIQREQGVNRKQQTNGVRALIRPSMSQLGRHVESILLFVSWRNNNRVSSIVVKIKYEISCTEVCTPVEPVLSQPILPCRSLFTLELSQKAEKRLLSVPLYSAFCLRLCVFYFVFSTFYVKFPLILL